MGKRTRTMLCCGWAPHHPFFKRGAILLMENKKSSGWSLVHESSPTPNSPKTFWLLWLLPPAERMDQIYRKPSSNSYSASTTGPPRFLFSWNKEKEDRANALMCFSAGTDCSLNWGRAFPIFLLDPLISPTQAPLPTPPSLQKQAACRELTPGGELLNQQGWVSRHLHHVA